MRLCRISSVTTAAGITCMLYYRIHLDGLVKNIWTGWGKVVCEQSRIQNPKSKGAFGRSGWILEILDSGWWRCEDTDRLLCKRYGPRISESGFWILEVRIQNPESRVQNACTSS